MFVRETKLGLVRQLLINSEIQKPNKFGLDRKIDNRKNCEYAKIYCGKWTEFMATVHKGRVDEINKELPWEF